MKLLGLKSRFESHVAAVVLTVVSSLNEAFGRTLIESMTLGTVVAIDQGGNPEAIVNGNTGFLMDSEDIGTIIPTIHPTISDPAAFEQTRSAALAEASDTHTSEPHLRSMIDVGRSLFQRINRRRH